MSLPRDIKKKIVIRALKNFGFLVVEESEHIKLKNENGVSISVPNHRTLKLSTLTNIVRSGGIDKAKFFSLL